MFLQRVVCFFAEFIISIQYLHDNESMCNGYSYYCTLFTVLTTIPPARFVESPVDADKNKSDLIVFLFFFFFFFWNKRNPRIGFLLLEIDAESMHVCELFRYIVAGPEQLIASAGVGFQRLGKKSARARAPLELPTVLPTSITPNTWSPIKLHVDILGTWPTYNWKIRRRIGSQQETK